MPGPRKGVEHESDDAGRFEEVALFLRLRRCPRVLLSLVRRHRALHGSSGAGSESESPGPVLRRGGRTPAPAGPRVVAGPGSRGLGAPDLGGPASTARDAP